MESFSKNHWIRPQPSSPWRKREKETIAAWLLVTTWIKQASKGINQETPKRQRKVLRTNPIGNECLINGRCKINKI